MLKVTLGAESWDFQPLDLSIGQMTRIEAETGVGLMDWLNAIDERRALPLQVLIWHLRGGTDMHAPASVRKRTEGGPTAVDFRYGDFSLRYVPEPVPPLPEEMEEEHEDSGTGGSPISSANTG
jgi:hypothetical protein